MAVSMKMEDEGTLGYNGPLFSPPLYKQRYSAVVAVARRLQPKKVVDFGCAECKLLRLLKKEEYIEELVGVDVDSVPLRVHSDLVRPLITDHLHPRPHPLYMALMQGSIAHPDAKLMNFDLLTCIEVIEHLEDPVLEAVPSAIFGFLRPQTVVMTTPNAEYNVLFPGFKGFRHHDHKFEWNREEFQTWCGGVCKLYGYQVEYGGVGEPPPDMKHVGQCSQMATFTLPTDVPLRVTAPDTPSSYTMIAEATHPHQVNSLTTDEKLRLECEYYCRVLFKSRSDDDEMCQIALKELLVFPRVRALTTDVQDIRRVLGSSSLIRLEQSADYAEFKEQEDIDELDTASSGPSSPSPGVCPSPEASPEWWG